jgi:hypothetical protein
LFIGTIDKYDDVKKLYNVKYADGYEQEYTLAEIKKYLKRENVANVRPQRERRQAVIGGKCMGKVVLIGGLPHYL